MFQLQYTHTLRGGKIRGSEGETVYMASAWHQTLTGSIGTRNGNREDLYLERKEADDVDT